MKLTQNVTIEDDTSISRADVSAEEMKKRIRAAWRKEKRSYDIYIQLCNQGSVGSRYSWLMMAHEALVREMTIRALMVDLGITESEIRAL